MAEVKKVSVFITSDGTIFNTIEEAKVYDDKIIGQREANIVLNKKEELLSRISDSLGDYYRLVNGDFYRSNRVSDALRSFFIDTPESTLKIIENLKVYDK